jgi:hypothetical protein
MKIKTNTEHIKQFLLDSKEVLNGKWWKLNELYKKYNSYCNVIDGGHVGKNILGREITNMGFEKKYNSTGVHYYIAFED